MSIRWSAHVSIFHIRVLIHTLQQVIKSEWAEVKSLWKSCMTLWQGQCMIQWSVWWYGLYVIMVHHRRTSTLASQLAATSWFCWLSVSSLRPVFCDENKLRFAWNNSDLIKLLQLRTERSHIYMMRWWRFAEISSRTRNDESLQIRIQWHSCKDVDF